MSAAGRGGERVALDNYPTPAWATRRILEALALEGRFGGLDRCPSEVWEPCAGDGAICRVVRSFFPRSSIIASDIDDRVRSLPASIANVAFIQDATATMLGASPRELLITNPPFNVAHEIIQAQRDSAALCVYLLRRNWLSSGSRAGTHYRHDMPDEYLLPDRPSFIVSSKCADSACGWNEKIGVQDARMAACPNCAGKVRHTTSDVAEYSWFVWGSKRRSEGRSIILPSTPSAERKA